MSELPHLEEYFNEFVPRAFKDKLKFLNLDFFKQEFPKTDVIIFGHILHDWNLEVRKMLIKKAWDSLDNKGKDAYIVVFDYFFYDELNRPHPFTMSLQMQVFFEGS